MGSGDQAQKAAATTKQNLDLSNQLFDIGSGGLSGAMGYLTQARAQGGTLDTSQKYDAMRANFLDTNAGLEGSFLQPKLMGDVMSGKASGLSGIGAEQIGGAVDEMNKIRSLLAGQGLKTTSLAASAGGLEADALRFMNPGNQTASMVKGGAGLAAGIYGGGQQAGWWGQAAGGGGANPPAGVNPGGFGF